MTTGNLSTEKARALSNPSSFRKDPWVWGALASQLACRLPCSNSTYDTLVVECACHLSFSPTPSTYIPISPFSFRTNKHTHTHTHPHIHIKTALKMPRPSPTLYVALPVIFWAPHLHATAQRIIH